MTLFRWQPLRALARYSTMEARVDYRNKQYLVQTRNHPDLLLHKCLENSEKIDHDKWAKIRHEMLSSKLIAITKVNIDAIILDTCRVFGQFDTAFDYCKYLKSQNCKFNLATTARYFKLLTDKNESITKDEQEDIIKIYDELREDYPLLDAATMEACIIGLSRTRRWRDGLELLKAIGESERPCFTSYRCIIFAAFNNDDPELAWEFLNKIGSILPPDREVYKSFLAYYTRASKTKEEFEGHISRLFEALGQWDIYPMLSALEEFGKALQTVGWSANQCSIRTSGVCSNCGHALTQMDINEKDFKYLEKSFLRRALVGKDVYENTTPYELAKFKKFIKASKPYDIVIDGLNVEYSLWNNKTRQVTGEKLAHVVRMLLNQNKKVMVLGRKHMMRWKKEHMEFLQNNTRFFVANNTSEDDPYLLYAALSGGLHTYIVSKDLMRQHKFILSDPELQRTFKLWLLTHRIHHTVKGQLQNKTIFLIYPPSYLPVAQQDENGWHVPAMENDLQTQPAAYELHQPWYCFRKKRIEGEIEAQTRLEHHVKS